MSGTKQVAAVWRRATSDELAALGGAAHLGGGVWPGAAVVVTEIDLADGAALAWDDRPLAAALGNSAVPVEPRDLATLGEPLVWLQVFTSRAGRDEFVERRFRPGARTAGPSADRGPTVIERLEALPPVTEVTAPASAYTSRYADALAFAAVAHADQRKKGTSQPYVPHLLRASSWVWANGGTEDQAIGALLHDALEDVGAAAAPLVRDRFGDEVLGIVEACSDTDQPGAKPPWLDRKTDHIAELAHAPVPALLVIAADKLDNLRQLTADLRRRGPEVWTSFKSGRIGAAWYYRSVVSALGARSGELDPDVIEELHSAVDELVALAAT